MQARPDKTALLAALAQFLVTEVRPALDDPALRFRVLIAAHLAGGIAREVATEDDLDREQLSGLQALLGEMPDIPGRGDERREAILAAQRQLVARIRSGEADFDLVSAHLQRVLAGTLTVSNPSFDLNPIIE
jgi:hypothetical protein